MRPILIRGGRIVDPSRGTDEVADLYLADGKVQAAGRDLGPPDDALVLEAGGKVVAPGLIDVHVHLREPGQEVRIVYDHHVEGLFPEHTWLHLLDRAGFEPRLVPGDPFDGDESQTVFVARRGG